MVFIYKMANVYSALIKVFGYERGARSFIDRLDLKFPEGARILDLCCGPGVVGLKLLERIPNSTLLATDLEKNFLKATLANARERGIDESRITVGVADVTYPDVVTLTDGTKLVLPSQSFDIVSIGASMGYSKDQIASFKTMLRLLKPGGHLINLEMSTNIVGRLIGKWYSCRPLPTDVMKRTFEAEGYTLRTIPFKLRDFPTNTTRIGLVAQSRAAQAEILAGAAPEYAGGEEVTIGEA